MGLGRTARRRALLTNDDGIDSPGLHALARAAREAGFDVVVAAPLRDCSGAGTGIIAVETQGHLLVEERDLPDLDGVEAYGVGALPGHIVLAAVRGWIQPQPDVVLSGVNHGANLGRAIVHSGTVGAAITASVNGVRGMAVSLDVGLEPAAPPHWETVASLVPDVLELLLAGPPAAVLTLNVPDRPAAELRPLRLARLADFGAVQTRFDRVQNDRLQLTVVEMEAAPEEGTDSALLTAGHPTLTALDSVSEATGPAVERWLGAARRRIA